MGTTGLIFGGLVVAWLAYLVPWYLSHRDQTPIDVEHTLNFTEDAKLIRFDAPVEDLADVSTPLMRMALKRELHVRSVRAARRRRRVLGLLLLSVTLLGITTAVGLTRWWTIVVATVALVLWLLASRWSTARLYRRLDDELVDIELADDEATLAISLSSTPVSLDDDSSEHEHSVEISGPVPTMSLWDPIPVTAATYVSGPLAPRTVRTIDLTAPAALTSAPVTADKGLGDGLQERRRASGE